MSVSKKNKDVPATKAESAPQADKRKPAKSFRIDDVSASIWAREHVVQGKPRTFWSVTFERSFKDRDGAYRYTKSFDPDSLGKLVTVAQQASDWISDAVVEADAAEAQAQQDAAQDA